MSETLKINLSSNTTGFVEVLPIQRLYDRTTLILNLTGLPETPAPLRLLINWGDTDEIVEVEGSFFKLYREDSILNEVRYGIQSLLLSQEYSHDYFPSSTTHQTTLTCQLVLSYSNGDQTIYRIPILIQTEGFHENIRDLYLEDVAINVVDGLKHQYVFSTKQDGYIIEGYTDN